MSFFLVKLSQGSSSLSTTESSFATSVPARCALAAAPVCPEKAHGREEMPSAMRGGSGAVTLLLASCFLCGLVSGLPRQRPPGSKAPDQEPVMGIDYGSEWIKIGVVTSGTQVRNPLAAGIA